MAKNNHNSLKLVINKKYRFKEDFMEPTLGKIPQGITAKFVCNTTGCAKFKLPNGKHVDVPEKSAYTFLEEAQ
jgi:hypothetical protein